MSIHRFFRIRCGKCQTNTIDFMLPKTEAIKEAKKAGWLIVRKETLAGLKFPEHICVCPDCRYNII